MSKKKKLQTFRDKLSNIYKPIEVVELLDLMYIRDRWDLKEKCDFDLTYIREHG